MPLAQQLDEGDGIQNKDLEVNEVINFEGKRWEINKLQILLPIDFIPRNVQTMIRKIEEETSI